MGDDTSAPAPVKPGWKTTEFWLHLIVTVCSLVMASGLPSSNKIVQVAGLVTAALSSFGYGAQRTIAKIASVLLLALLFTGCKAINKEATKAYQDKEQALMTELTTYRGAKDVSDIQAHLKNVSVGVSSVSTTEETTLIAELLADVQSDAAKSDGKKQSESAVIKAHLDDFNSLHR